MPLMRVRVVSDDPGFDRLADVWIRLHAAVGGSAFESYEWQRAWWHHFGGVDRGCALQILVVEIDGDVVGIAPLLLRSRRVLGPLRLRTLQFLGAGISDYLGILCLEADAAAVAAAIAAHLLDVEFDMLLLCDQRDQSSIGRNLLTRLDQLGWAVVREECECCPHTTLGTSWDETLSSFSQSHRQRLLYIQRRMEKQFAVDFHRVVDPDEVDSAVDSLIDMHQQHWVNEGFGGAFERSDVRRFYVEVVPAFLKRGWLFLTLLRLDGKVAASLLAFKVGGSLQAYIAGRGSTDEFAKFSPGLAIHIYSMQAMIQEAVRDYDFLRGTEGYKYALGALNAYTWSMVAFKPGARYARWKHELGVRKDQLVEDIKALRRRIRRRLYGTENRRPVERAPVEGS